MPALLIRKSRCRKCLLKSWKKAATERSSRTSELLRITRAAAASGCGVSPARSGRGREARLLVSILLCSDQREEFLARLRVLTKDAKHGRGDCCRMLFLDPSHHHAEMARFDHDTNALGLDGVLDGFGNFGGQALLHLETPRKDLDQ